MRAQDAFADFVSREVVPVLKAEGFRKKGFTFHRAFEEVVHVIQIQKSAYSTSATVRFTINVSVFSFRLNRLRRELSGWAPEIAGVPRESACQVRVRIGRFTPKQNDLWWDVEDSGHLPDVASEVRRLLSAHALPFLAALRSDTDLRDRWLREWKANETGLEGLELAFLLLELGPRDELSPLLASLRSEAPPHATGFVATLDRLEKDPRRAS